MPLPPDHSLRPFTKFYCFYVGITALTDGLAFLFFPNLVRSVAYGWAHTLLPGWCWGIIFLVIGATCLRQFKWVNLDHLRNMAALSIFVYSTFSLSIFALTLSGSVGAIVGTTKWWAIVAMSVFLLSNPMTYPTGKLGDWWYRA